MAFDRYTWGGGFVNSPTPVCRTSAERADIGRAFYSALAGNGHPKYFPERYRPSGIFIGSRRSLLRSFFFCLRPREAFAETVYELNTE